MYRSVYRHLEEWKKSGNRKPILLRGARQVGKSWLARELGKTFPSFVEINFEERSDLTPIFDGELSPDHVLPRLSAAAGRSIVPGETLLFLDEVQACPRAITALRYFYEKLPGLHVLAAGSLLEFAIERIGMPVGRVSSLYCYPLSFYEFLLASGQRSLIEYIRSLPEDTPLDGPLHAKALTLLSEYMVVGGMPEAVREWVERRDIPACKRTHQDIVENYRQDFGKYARLRQREHVELVFSAVPRLTGRKLVFSHISDSLRSRELKPALELLQKAAVVHTVCHSSGNGLPLAAEANHALFKNLLLDVALMQSILHLDPGLWLLDPDRRFVNEGSVIEAFVGQELIAYRSPFERATLHYWVREKNGANAEVDYLIEKDGTVVPVEVKSGSGGKLKSLELFLSEKKNSVYGLQVSAAPAGMSGKIRRVPLYALWLFAEAKK